MKPLVVGLGSVDRGDDAVRVLVVRQVADARGRRDRGLGPVALWWIGRGRDVMVLVDAVSSGSAPGTVHVVEVGDQALPIRLAAASTHWVGWATRSNRAGARHAASAGRGGRNQAGALSPGPGLSAPVNEAMPLAVAAGSGFARVTRARRRYPHCWL